MKQLLPQPSEAGHSNNHFLYPLSPEAQGNGEPDLETLSKSFPLFTGDFFFQLLRENKTTSVRHSLKTELESKPGMFRLGVVRKTRGAGP